MNRSMDTLKGGATAVLSSLLVATLFAYLFRLPIPLVGYLGPFGEVSPHDAGLLGTLKAATWAWAFYGVLGGYIVLFVLGAISARWIGRRYSGSRYKNRLIFSGAVCVSVACVFVLSVLDYIIGPW